MKEYYVYQKGEAGSEHKLSSSQTLQGAIKSAQDEWGKMCESDRKKNKIYVCKYTNGTIEEIEESGSDCWNCDTYTWGLANYSEVKDKVVDILKEYAYERYGVQHDFISMLTVTVMEDYVFLRIIAKIIGLMMTITP